MSLERAVQMIHIGDWVVREHVPSGFGPFPTIILLHGWTGDENSMWVFASRLPHRGLLLAPRGPYPSPLGGYGWHPYRAQAWPGVDDFRPAIQTLMELLTPENFPLADFSRLHLAGFSQGAAMAYTFVLLHGEQIASLAGLSGFMPDGAETLVKDGSLGGKPIFIAHGSLDDLVPVDRARKAVELFQEAGAQVTYCEDEVGHKLSANCFRGLETFFARQAF